MKKNTYLRILAAVLLLLVAVVSCLWVGDKASSVASHAVTIKSLDDKADTVLKLSAASVAASAVISAFPDDTATPIADKLADFTEYFLLILCVIYAEKYGVTILGAAAFRILIPLACIAGIVWIFRRSPRLKKLAMRLVVFALALAFVIPTGTWVSDKIYATYEISINNTIEAAEQFSLEDDEGLDAGSENGLIRSFFNGIKTSVSGLLDRASDTLKRFVEVLALLLVTSCLIPVLVLLFFIWLAKNLSGIDIGGSFPPPPFIHKWSGCSQTDQKEGPKQIEG